MQGWHAVDMHINTVVGSIHPEAGGWYFNEPVMAMHGDEEIQLAVKHSKFSIRVTSPGDEEVDGDWFRQVWLRASAALRSALDALWLLQGRRARSRIRRRDLRQQGRDLRGTSSPVVCHRPGT
jgi:hypothetical protein